MRDGTCTIRALPLAPASSASSSWALTAFLIGYESLVRLAQSGGHQLQRRQLRSRSSASSAPWAFQGRLGAGPDGSPIFRKRNTWPAKDLSWFLRMAASPHPRILACRSFRTFASRRGRGGARAFRSSPLTGRFIRCVVSLAELAIARSISHEMLHGEGRDPSPGR
jgi:hypothetical protein